MKKKLIFVGDSRKRIQEFPDDVQRDAGHRLLDIQEGKEPSDVKVLVDMPAGIKELRLWDESGTFRVVFVAKFEEAVYVLHAFQKKTQATSLRDLNWRGNDMKKSVHSEATFEEFEDVWEALDFTPEEAASLRVRSELMTQIETIIKQQAWTQAEAARRCGVSQPRISELMHGRISKFSLDALVKIASALGRKVHLLIEAA